ncbi:MAG: DUF6132 family protein [Bacillota bacterium]
MKLNHKIVVKRVLPVFAGAVLGYAYYYFVGCSSGSCPIQSNPYLTVGYGALTGAIFSFPDSKKPRTEKNQESLK